MAAPQKRNATDGQKRYLNDLGYTPDEIKDKTFEEAKAAIEDREAELRCDTTA